MSSPDGAKYKIEIYERPIGFLDDNFRGGWVLIRSAASQSFVNNGGLVADLGVMSVTESGLSDGCGYERNIESLNLSTDTYRKCRVRLKGAGYNPMYYVLVTFTDATTVNVGWAPAPSEMTIVTLSLPTGKTILKIELFARAGNGGNNQSATVYYDYVAIIKDDPIVPTEVESLDMELCATTAISGFKFTLLNHRGIYTEKPSVGDLAMIYLAAKDENLDQKLIAGYITDKEVSGDPENPTVTMSGSDLGQILHDRTFTKKYETATKISQIVKDIRDQELTELTVEVDPDTDNSITPEFNEEGVFNLLRKLANAAQKNGRYGYDFYVDPAGCLHFVQNPKYTCQERIYAGILYDDFRGNLDKWIIMNGTWTIENEELSQSEKASDFKRTWAGKASLQDYTVKADAKYVADGNSQIGIAFRAQDENHFYALLIDKANGTLQLYWTENGGATLNPIGLAVTGLVFNDNQFYELKAQLEGNTIKCYLNNELKKNEADTHYATGKIGLLTRQTHAHYDNIEVKAANEPPYNIKKITWKETTEDVANQIQLLTHEAEYTPKDKDAWTENTENWEGFPELSVELSVDNTDKKVGNNSILASFTSIGTVLRLRRKVSIDISLFKKIKLWDKWSFTGPADWFIIRLGSDNSPLDYYEKKLWVGQTAGVPKPWGTQEVYELKDFTKVGNPSNDIVLLEIMFSNVTENLGSGYVKIDGLHFAVDPLVKTSSDSESQIKYGKKERDFEDFTITDENFAQYMANDLCQALKNPIKHVHVLVLGRAQEGYRPPAQVRLSSAKDNIQYEYFKILKVRHHYVTSRDEAPLYICDIDLIVAEKTDGSCEIPIMKEPWSIKALKLSAELARRLDSVARKGYYWY